MTDQKFLPHVSNMLALWKKTIAETPYDISETGAVNLKGDRTMGIDKKLEEVLVEYIKTNNLPVDIFSEEIGMIKFHRNPTHLMSFDPLDGSINYKVGKGLYPFGFLLAVFKGLSPKMKDVIAAVSHEQTKNITFFYDGNQTTDARGKKIRVRENWQVSTTTPIYFDLAWIEGYKEYTPLVPKFFMRSSGSTIGNLSFLLSNVSALFGHVFMHAEEAGAVYGLIKGAEGIIVDHTGKDMADKIFSPEAVYKALGGNKEMVRFAIEEMKKYGRIPKS